MRFPSPGRSRSVEEFEAQLSLVAPDLVCDLELLGADGPLGRPFEIAGRTVGNRFAIHPMEGWDATRDGAPSELTLRRWRRFGKSGAKLIWG